MNARDIFIEALQKDSASQRGAYLAVVCGVDEDLRRHVEGLLEAHERASGFLEPPARRDVPTVDVVPSVERPGAMVGPYKLLQQIGEGGMGAVFMAEQTHPVQRRVAVKLIKAGMDSSHVVARFEAERQALALMDHPNIAKVLDAGIIGGDGGRPYFVMELVKGVPITRFCDEHRLTPRQRLELFVPVCAAIQHAHQKGIIHRDLKPSNVLVALYDGKPVPKVIDFGIAKAIGQKLTERTLFTEFGSVVGTLEYMSPEQAELNQLDIDTRSDVYSLGVLLYELLTDTTPLERNRLKESGLLEALRLIREEEPPKPSARLSSTKQAANIAANRGLDRAKLSGALRGELDWVVMKCLEKDRDRRYETANSLAQDIGRYLADEPVQACPPTTAYRLQKLVRRYKRALVMAGVVLAGLVLAVVGLTVSTVLTWQAKAKVEQTLVLERQSLYFQRIALADRELASNNLTRAEELLQLCPPELRDWEWHYLNRSLGRAPLRMRHDHAISGKSSLSPDGRRIAVVGRNGAVTIWDVGSGTVVRVIAAHTRTGWMIAYSPDGRFLASSDEPAGKEAGSGEVKLWDPETGVLLHHWEFSNRFVNGMAFSPDGNRLAVSGWGAGEKDETVEIRDSTTGKVLLPLASRSTVQGLAFSPDGRHLAVASNDMTVQVVESRTGQLVFDFRDDRFGNHPYWCAAFSPDGKLVAAGYGIESDKDPGGVRIWEVSSGREVMSLAGHAVHGIAFQSGQRLATAGLDGSVRIWDLNRGQELLTLRGHKDVVQSLCFTRDGNRLLSCSFDREVRVWDASPVREGERLGDELQTLTGHTNGVKGLAFHPTQPLLATASSDGTVLLWNTRMGYSLHKTLDLNIKAAHALTFSPDGKCLAVGGQFIASLLDVSTGKPVRNLELDQGDWPHRLAFSPDGKLAAGANLAGSSAEVLVWETATGKVRHLQGLLPFVYGVAFGPDPSKPQLACVSTGGEVRIWNPVTGQLIRPALEHEAATGVAFSPDGRLLATVGWDKVVRIWDTTTWKVKEQLRDPTGGPNSVAFSPDSKLLVWGGTDSTVKVWLLGTEEVATLRGHRNWVWDVSFSPAGETIASASRDTTIKIWKTPTFARPPAQPNGSR